MTPTHISSTRGWHTGRVYHWFNAKGAYYAVIESEDGIKILDFKGNDVPNVLFDFLKPKLVVTDDMRRGL